MNYILAFLIPLLFISCSNNTTEATDIQKEPFTVSRSIAKATLAPVPINAKILLNISTELKASTITTSTVFIKNSSNTIVPITVNYQKQVISISPKVYLQPNSDYTIWITTNVLSLQGEHLSQDTKIFFTSAGALPDITPPVYLGTNFVAPKQANSILYFQFDESISPLSVTPDMLQISLIATGKKILSSVKVSGDMLIFTPESPLLQTPDDLGYHIILTLDNRVQDLSGNKMSTIDVNLSTYIEKANQYLQFDLNLSSSTHDTNSRINTLTSDTNFIYLGHNNGFELLEFDLTSGMFSTLDILSAQEIGSVYCVESNLTSKRIYLGTSLGFFIIDSSDVNVLKIVSKFKTNAPVYNLTLYDQHAYLAATFDGLIDLNITNENNLLKVSTPTPSSLIFDVTYYDNNLYISDYNRTLNILDLNMQSLSALEASKTGQHLRNLEVAIEAKHIYIAAGVSGLKYFDTTVVSTPIIENGYTLPSYANKVSIVDNFAYVNLISLGIFTFSTIDIPYPVDYLPNDGRYQQLYVPKPYIDIKTFTYIQDDTASNKYLIMADKLGKIYSSKLP